MNTKGADGFAPFFVLEGSGYLMVINVYVVSSLRGTKQSWFCVVMLAVCHTEARGISRSEFLLGTAKQPNHEYTDEYRGARGTTTAKVSRRGREARSIQRR